MKRLWFYPVIAVVFMVNTASMCSDDDDDPSGPSATDVQQTVTSGTWRVTNFSEDGIDHTNYFIDYTFTFAATGVLTADRTDGSVVGGWSVTNDDSGVDFNIMFTSPSAFEEISEDWDILERTNTKLRLRHVSGGDGDIDLLTFQKN